MRKTTESQDYYEIILADGLKVKFRASLVVAQQSGALFVYQKYEGDSENTLVGVYAPTYRVFSRVDGVILAQD